MIILPAQRIYNIDQKYAIKNIYAVFHRTEKEVILNLYETMKDKSHK